jgi:integrase
MARPRNPVPVVHVSKKPPYVAWWSHDGKIIRRGCSAATRTEAIKIADQRFQEWRNPPAPAAYTIGQLLEAYIADRTKPVSLGGEPYSASFLYNLKHVRPFFASYTAAMLTPDAWKAYRAFRGAMLVNNAGTKAARVKTQKPIKPTTIKRELNALRGAIIWGRVRKWAGLPAKEEMQLKGFSEDNTRHVFLTRAEFDALLAALKETPHLQLFCLLSVATAGRMSAVLALKWTAVSLGFDDEPTLIESFPFAIAARTHANGAPAPARQRRWDNDRAMFVAPIVSTKDRTIILRAPITFDLGRGRGNKKTGSGYVDFSNQRLYLALADAYRNRRSEFVVEFRGKGIKSVDLSDAFERADIPQAKRTQHVLKHTCCSWLRQAGTDWRDMASLTGTSEETLKRHYAHIAPEDLRKVSASLAL